VYKGLLFERRPIMRAKRIEEKTVSEVGEVGRYRVRVVENGDGVRKLDVREYIESSATGYVGFTRKGIRLDAAQVEQLRGQMTEAADFLADVR
jgi:hypothetical protein